MSISSLLSTIIAIAFLYFILSVIASSIQEMIAGWLALRGKTLLAGLEGLIIGKSPATPAVKAIAKSIVDHALVSGTSTNRNPSYVPGGHFSTAIIDVLTKGSSAPQITAIQNGVAGLPKTELKSVLTAILRQTSGDLDTFRSAVDKWYDNAMTRLGGVYKRKSQVIIFAIGLALVLVLNVDAMRVVRGLSHSDYGTAAAKAAENYLKEHPDGKFDSLSQYLDQLDSLSLDIGWKSCGELSPKVAPDSCKGSFSAFLNNGMSDPTVIVWAVVGWLLSATLISFGAPFWFDLMTTFVNLRSTGAKPKTDNDEKLVN